MKDKKELILNKCRDLIYKEVFNNDYDYVKRIYTDNVIQMKLDDYLDELIGRGELFYGDNFVNDFVNERTDDARLWLISDLKSNGIEDKIPKNDYSNLKPKDTYESVIAELVNNCYFSLDKANEFIKKYVKDSKIRQGAEDYFKQKEASNDLEEPEKTEESQEEDFSGLDKTAPEFENLTPEPINDEEPIKVQTEEAKPGLLKRFKEKWQNPKFKRNVVISSALLAVGMVAIALNPDVQSFIGQLLSNFDPNQIDSNMVSQTSNMFSNGTNSITQSIDPNLLASSNIDPNALTSSTVDPNVLTLSTAGAITLDTSSWNMEGLHVAQSAYDAVLGKTNFIANSSFSNILQGFFDVSTGQMLKVSPEDLQNADFVKDVLQNTNISAVFGNGEINTLNDVSGFVNGGDVIDLIDNGRCR